jgi:hypothetical protein
MKTKYPTHTDEFNLFSEDQLFDNKDVNNDHFDKLLKFRKKLNLMKNS